MDEVEFDKFADEYRAMHAANIRLSGENPEYFAEYKIVDIAAELARDGIVPHRALDFGAGVGYSVPFFARHLPAARVTCLDVSRKSLDVGAAQHGNAAEFTHFDGRRIPFEDGTFDVALASCVFHHIPHDEHVSLLAEIRRVLRAEGRGFIFEHNPLNPLTRHAVNTCEFDEHAHLVLAPAMRRRVRDAGFADAAIRYRIFFPHALRGLRALEPKMTWLPLGAQYYVVARKS
ncbi:MAG TPA: class I SAM-dependent methyltransferase [Gammaproteobacteria bacterium]|nr:class I SAM-dependent methyltransferase [Gammaproteobacteria bacterium]